MNGLNSENRGFRKRDVDPLRNPRKTKKKKKKKGKMWVYRFYKW